MRLYIYLLLSTLFLQSRSSLYQVAETAFRSGDMSASEQYMRSALAKLPHQQGKIYFNLGQIFLQSQQWDSAQLYFEKSLHLLPETWAAEARNNLGYIGIQQGKLPEALKQFRHALRKHPANSKARFNYELAYRKLQIQLPTGDVPNRQYKGNTQAPARFRKPIKGERADLVYLQDSLNWEQLPHILKILQEKEFTYLQQLKRIPRNYSLSTDKPNW